MLRLVNTASRMAGAVRTRGLCYGGRHLVFYDRGYWQNLTDYGFNDQMSSYIVGACSSHLAENTNGGGYWYPGNTNAGSAVSYVGAAWNDRVSSIYIN